MKSLGFSGSLLVAALLAQIPAFASPLSLTVSVGYADNTHCADFNKNPGLCVANPPSTFPNPWSGSPGIANFFGTGVNGVGFDAGALLLTNNSGSDVTVSDVTVIIGTNTFDLWQNFVVPNSQSDILTQTAFDPTTLSPNFDTSDTTPQGSPACCTNDGLIPIIMIKIGGNTFTLHDTSQILNTGGFDVGCTDLGCALTNESHPWTLLAAAQPTPEPSSLLLLGTGLLAGISRMARGSQK